MLPTPRYIGRVPYRAAFAMQTRLVPRVARGEAAPTLFGLEHDPVITLGKHAALREDGVVDLPFPREFYATRGIAIEQSDRGGRATWHGPGQLVIYTVMPLAPYRLGVRAFVERLMHVTTDLLMGYGIEVAYRDDDPGLYVTATGAKICSAGIRVVTGVSYHGIAINLSADLSAFTLFSACGHPGMAFANAADLGAPADPRRVFADFSHRFLSTLA